MEKWCVCLPELVNRLVNIDIKFNQTFKSNNQPVFVWSVLFARAFDAKTYLAIKWPTGISLHWFAVILTFPSSEALALLLKSHLFIFYFLFRSGKLKTISNTFQCDFNNLKAIKKEHCDDSVERDERHSIIPEIIGLTSCSVSNMHGDCFKKNYQTILPYFNTHFLLICIKIPELGLEQLTKAIEHLLCKHFVTFMRPGQKQEKMSNFRHPNGRLPAAHHKSYLKPSALKWWLQFESGH